MSSRKRNELKERFKKLDRFDSSEERIEHEKMVSMFKFLSKVQKELDRKNWPRKKLASEVGVSESYLSQLFHGEKVINLETMIKISQALNCEFELKLITGNGKNNEEAIEEVGVQ